MTTMPGPDVTVRAFERADVPVLLNFMRGLAQFEGYIAQFRVTETDLIAHGLSETPLFQAYVAEPSNGGDLLGMAVTYLAPWTYDLKPTLVLKELFVAREARGRGVGSALMQRVAREAQESDTPRVIWTVVKGNEAAAAFYRRLGGELDEQWQPWILSEGAIKRLANSGA